MTFLDSVTTAQDLANASFSTTDDLPSIGDTSRVKDSQYSKPKSLNALTYQECTSVLDTNNLHGAIKKFVVESVIKKSPTFERSSEKFELVREEHDSLDFSKERKNGKPKQDSRADESIPKDPKLNETKNKKRRRTSDSEDEEDEEKEDDDEVVTHVPKWVADLVLKTWVEKLTPIIISEVWTLGLLSVSMIDGKDRDKTTNLEDLIPEIHRFGLGTRYDIQVAQRKHSSRLKYTFRWIEQLKPDVIDDDVMIFDDFDASPFPDTGTLRSVTSTLLVREARMNEQENMSLIATINMARPMVLMERSSAAKNPSSRTDSTGPVIGGQVGVSQDLRSRAAEASADLELSEGYLGETLESWLKQLDALKRQGIAVANQSIANTFPLPTDFTSARYQQSVARSDFESMKISYEEHVCAAYGIQRSHILSASHTRYQVREELANAALVNALNRWRVQLGNVYTTMFWKLFPEYENTVFVRFQVYPQDTWERLYEKYVSGAITWRGLLEMTASISNIPEDYMEWERPSVEEMEDRRGETAQTETSGERKKDLKPKSGSVRKDKRTMQKYPASTKTKH